MLEKDIISTLERPARLIENEYYFKYIFKKTEKIVSAVFYILSKLEKVGAKDVVIGDLEREALSALVFVGQTLSLQEREADEAIQELVLKLTLLESKLRVFTAASLLPQSHMDVFAAEIDATIRATRNLRQREMRKYERKTSVRADTRQDVAEKGHNPPQTEVDRRSRILAVLRAHPGASVKDISDTVTDCSEKTIQRELNDMIKDNLVIREGEKRWSRYSLFS